MGAILLFTGSEDMGRGPEGQNVQHMMVAKIPKSQSCSITCGKVPPCNACISATWQPQSFGGKQCRKASAGQLLLWKSRLHILIFKNYLGFRILPNKPHFWNSFTRLCRKSEQKAGVWRLLQPFLRKNHVPASAELVQYAWPQFSFLGPIEVLDTLDIEKGIQIPSSTLAGLWD